MHHNAQNLRNQSVPSQMNGVKIIAELSIFSEGNAAVSVRFPQSRGRRPLIHWPVLLANRRLHMVQAVRHSRALTALGWYPQGSTMIECCHTRPDRLLRVPGWRRIPGQGHSGTARTRHGHRWPSAGMHMATETPPRARKPESLHHLRGHWFVSTSALVGRIRFHVGVVALADD
jgi:hypothetical protein